MTDFLFDLKCDGQSPQGVVLEPFQKNFMGLLFSNETAQVHLLAESNLPVLQIPKATSIAILLFPSVTSPIDPLAVVAFRHRFDGVELFAWERKEDNWSPLQVEVSTNNSASFPKQKFPLEHKQLFSFHLDRIATVNDLMSCASIWKASLKNNILQLKLEYEIDLSSFHSVKNAEKESTTETNGAESSSNDLPNSLLLTASHLFIGTYNAKIFVYTLPHNKHGINHFRLDYKSTEPSEVTFLKENHVVELPSKETKQKPVVSRLDNVNGQYIVVMDSYGQTYALLVDTNYELTEYTKIIRIKFHVPFHKVLDYSVMKVSASRNDSVSAGAIIAVLGENRSMWLASLKDAFRALHSESAVSDVLIRSNKIILIDGEGSGVDVVPPNCLLVHLQDSFRVYLLKDIIT
mmetsp:Transcript_20325/g.28501  ORF Transcript_20325/g.28501 Transcript_20325/m.28501 type:complete len:405 (+) Transcript_20325:71-1285(+)